MYGSCKYLFNAYLDTTLRKYLYVSGQQFLYKRTKVEKPLGSHETVLYINITDEKCIRFSIEFFLCNYFVIYCKLYHNLPESSIQKDSDRLNARGSKMTSKFTVISSLLFFLSSSIYSFFFSLSMVLMYVKIQQLFCSFDFDPKISTLCIYLVYHLFYFAVWFNISLVSHTSFRSYFIGLKNSANFVIRNLTIKPVLSNIWWLSRVSKTVDWIEWVNLSRVLNHWPHSNSESVVALIINFYYFWII